MNSNMNEYIPPRPRSRRSRRFKMVSFPAIQELEKNIAPPGSTPGGSLTDLTGDEGKTMVDCSTTTCKFLEDYDNNNNISDHRMQETEDRVRVISAPSLPQRSFPSAQTQTEKKMVRIGQDTFHEYPRSDSIPSLSSSSINSTCATVSSAESIPQRAPAASRRYTTSVSQTQASRVSSQRSLIRRQPSVDISVDSGRHHQSIMTDTTTDLDFQPSHYPNNNSTWASNFDYSSSKIVRRASRKSSPFPRLKSILTELKQRKMVFDRTTAIAVLKDRIMRGENVSYDEIFAIKSLNLRLDQKHLGWRLPWSMDLYCEKGLVHIPTPNKPIPPGPNTFGTMEDLRIFLDHTEEDHGRRRYYQLNLAGFRDEEISLYLEGKNRLVIRAVREYAKMRLPTIVTETIILPPDLAPDNLRIVRKPSGITIIEESWRF